MHFWFSFSFLIAFYGILLSAHETIPKSVKLSWIFETNSSIGYCHMSMIEKISDTILVAAFQGAKVHEGYNDQAIYFTKTHDAAKSWEDVQMVVSGGDYAVWGPVLHWDDTRQRLWLFYAQSVPFAQRSTNRSDVGGNITYIISDDHGEHWSDPVVIHPYDYQGLTCPKITANKLIVTKYGSHSAWVLPFWQTPTKNSTDKQEAGVLISLDAGATWERSMIKDSPTKLIENTIAETRNGTLFMFFRTGTGYLYQSWSYDMGKSWSTPKQTTLLNPNSKIFMFTDTELNQILAFNPTKKGRNPLVLGISKDNGHNFTQFVNLDPGIKSKSLEYPTSAQLGNLVLTAFSADHYTGIKLAITTLPDMDKIAYHK